MSFTGIFWTFCLSICATRLMFLPAAAASPSGLTCNVTQQPDGSFRYHLSRPPSSSHCDTCWEDHNKTVIARKSNFNTTLVQNLTDQFVTMKLCHAYLHYTQNCWGAWEEANCEINCSRLLDVKSLPPTTVNSTLICITESWCVTQLVFGLGVAGILLLVVGVLVVLLCCNFFKCRRRESADMRVPYTPADGAVIMEQQEMMAVTIKA